MKTRLFKKVLSFSAFAVFLLFAIATDDTTLDEYLESFVVTRFGPQITFTEKIGDSGDIKVTTGHSGNRKDGEFTGPVTIEIKKQNEFGGHSLHSTENVTLRNGIRWGKSETFMAPNGPNIVRYYEAGVEVDPPNIIGAIDTRSNLTSFEVLEARYPWFVEQILQMRNQETTFHDFLDEVDKRMDEQYYYDPYSFEENFEQIYFQLEDEGIFLPEISTYEDLGLLDFRPLFNTFEFRRAIHDYFNFRQSSIFSAVKHIYPNLLEALLEEGYTESEIEAFFNEFQSMIQERVNPATDELLFADSLDVWTMRVWVFMLNDENINVTNIARYVLKDIHGGWTLSNLKRSHLDDSLVDAAGSRSNSDIAWDLVSILSRRQYELDVVIQAAKPAFFRRNGHELPPLLSAQIEDHTEANLSIVGNILDAGTGNIMERGFVWDTIYTPTLESNRVMIEEDSDDFTLDITDLEPGKRYYIMAYTMYNYKYVFSNRVEVTFGELSSTRDIPALKLNFTLFPNPSQGAFTIQLDKEYPTLELSVFDLSGKMLYRQSYKHTNQISDVLDLPTGTYLLHLKTNDSQETQKLFIR